MRQISSLVARCSDCPFLEFVEQEITTAGEHKDVLYRPGFLCLHKAKRGYIALQETLEMNKWRTLTQALNKLHGQPFPPDCPLPEVEPLRTPDGRRAVNV